MRRYNNNGRQGWGANRPDYFPNGSSHRENAIGRRDNVGFNRQQTEGDREGRPTEDANHDDSVGYKLDCLLDRLDRWDSWRDETDRRFDNFEPNPNRRYDQRTGYDDDDSDGDGARRRRSWERGSHPRNPNFGALDSPRRDRYRREGRNQRGSCWDPPRYQQHRHQIGGYDQQFNRPATCYDPPQLRQPSCWEPSRGYSDYDQPPLAPPSRWDPPDYRCPQTLQPTKSDRPLSHRTAPLSTVATHPPQQSCRFIDSGKQRGLPNIPSLKVCSPYPAQLAAVSDYNEKLHIYRLKQASLLAELNATFEENIDDENLVEDVPNNAAHNGGANLDVDVPIDESLEEIVKTDNTPRQVLVGAYDEKIDDLSVPTHKELEMREDTETLLEKENKAEALRSSLELKEKDFSVLMEKPSERESMENQSLVNDIQAGFDMKKQDNQEEMEEKRRLFEDELKLKAEELGKTGDAHSGSHALSCVYVDLNVGDVPSMNHRSTSLDTDARLIPPRNDTPCLSIVGGVNRLFILARNFGGHIRSPSLISYGGDRGIHSTIRYVFDPGGDASPKLLLTTTVVASYIPP